MADFRGKANKLEKNHFLCYRKQRVKWTIFHPFPPAQVFFYQGDDLSDESFKVWHCYSIYLW